MNKMKAVVLKKFGDERELVVEHVPIPETGSRQILLHNSYAGIGSWDVFEREGGYVGMTGAEPAFPYILGSEGAGVIVDKGKDVTRFKIGDAVCASGFLNPKGGFYAEFTAVDEETVSKIPGGYSPCEAGVILGVGLTGLRGLSDVLNLKTGESVCIFGASGGIGHIAAQLALKTGARVCAIVSGTDGIEYMQKSGINHVFEGHQKDLLKTINSSGFNYFDKVLLTAGGAVAEEICRYVKPDGKIAFPSGIYPEPGNRIPVQPEKYYGNPDNDIITRLIRKVEKHKIKPHIYRVFNLEDIVTAHRFIKNHYIGKIAIKIS